MSLDPPLLVRRVRDPATLPPDDPPPSAPPPSPLGPLRPVAERWPVVLAVVLLFVGAAVYVGLSRSPTHRAVAQIAVGRTDVRVQALPGYVAGAAALANAYSRVVESGEIVDRVARRLGQDPGAVAGRLTAAPVPENPILRIAGTGDDAGAAVRVVRAASAELQRYVQRTDDSRSDLAGTLRRFRAESRRAAELREEISDLTARRPLGAAAREERTSDLAEARVSYDEARLRADSLARRWDDRQSELAGTAGIQVISRAAPDGDDRRPMLQRLIAVGLLAGVVVGAALAMLLGRRRRRTRPVAT